MGGGRIVTRQNANGAQVPVFEPDGSTSPAGSLAYMTQMPQQLAPVRPDTIPESMASASDVFARVTPPPNSVAYQDPNQQSASPSPAQPAPSTPGASRTFAVPGNAAGVTDDGVNAAILPTTPGRGGRTVMATTGISTTTNNGVPEVYEAVKAGLPGLERAAQAAERNGNIEGDESAALAARLDPRNRALEGLRSESVQNEQSRIGDQRQARSTFEQAAQSARSIFVDPDRRSEGNRALGGIASFLGGLAGGPNQALAAVQESLQRDLQAQIHNQANANNFAGNMATAYNMARANGATEREAEATHMGFEYANAADEAERLAAMANSEVARNNGIIIAEQMRARSLAEYARAGAAVAPRSEVTTQQRPVHTGGTSQNTPLRLTGPDGQVREFSVEALKRAGMSVNDLLKMGYVFNGPAAGGGDLEAGDATNMRLLGQATAESSQVTHPLRSLLSSMERNGGDAPGIGPIEGRLQDIPGVAAIARMFEGPDAPVNRQRLAASQTALLHRIIGTGQGLGEAERTKPLYQAIQYGTNAEAAAATRELIAIEDHTLNLERAGHTSRVRNTYDRQAAQLATPPGQVTPGARRVGR